MSEEPSCFNPRPRKGATPPGSLFGPTGDVSIHAPVRERRGINGKSSSQVGFNPRPRKGATVPWSNGKAYWPVSIHAPVRERLTVHTISSALMSFNPRPRKGATTQKQAFDYYTEFQSTPP